MRDDEICPICKQHWVDCSHSNTDVAAWEASRKTVSGVTTIASLEKRIEILTSKIAATATLERKVKDLEKLVETLTNRVDDLEIELKVEDGDQFDGALC